MKISRIETTEQEDKKKPKGIKYWVKVFFSYKWSDGTEKETKGFWSPSFLDIVKISRSIADAEEKTYPQKDGLQGKKMMVEALREIIPKDTITEEDIIRWKKKYKFLGISEESIPILKRMIYYCQNECGRKVDNIDELCPLCEELFEKNIR